MFNTARLKLTAWYLMTIMVVSIFFSMIIYRGLVGEIERITSIERSRFGRGNFQPGPIPAVFLDPDIIEDIKRRIIFGLTLINGAILISAGGLGYFLAGKTLKPISDMVDEQNRFISDASHELRTPLTSLKTSMEVTLRDKNLDVDGAKKLISESISDVNRLQSLSEGMLQLTQFQQPNENLKFEKISTKSIISESIKRIKMIADKKLITINAEGKNFNILGNRFGLADLMVIILDNAVKYSKTKGKIFIETKKADGTVEIYVKDQGIGISKKDLPHVFDRFYRADEARTKSNQGGYGLGLSIAKKIVKMHNGGIKAESKQGKGTTIIIKLPIKS